MDPRRYKVVVVISCGSRVREEIIRLLRGYELIVVELNSHVGQVDRGLFDGEDKSQSLSVQCDLSSKQDINCALELIRSKFDQIDLIIINGLTLNTSEVVDNILNWLKENNGSGSIINIGDDKNITKRRCAKVKPKIRVANIVIKESANNESCVTPEDISGAVDYYLSLSSSDHIHIKEIQLDIINGVS